LILIFFDLLQLPKIFLNWGCNFFFFLIFIVENVELRDILVSHSKIW
jgi:hypothetical protein